MIVFMSLSPTFSYMPQYLCYSVTNGIMLDFRGRKNPSPTCQLDDFRSPKSKLFFFFFLKLQSSN